MTRSSRVPAAIASSDGRAAPTVVARVAVTVVLLAAGCLWWTWLVAELSHPVTAAGHHDFFAFYSAATLVHTGHPQQLYDSTALTQLQRRILPQPVGYAGYMPYLNPPVAAAVLSPLAALPFTAARLVWFGVSLALAMACAVLLTRRRPLWLRTLAVLLVLASFPAFQALVEGQWSFVLLLGCLAAVAAARRGRQWIAGAALAVLWLKPPLLLLVLVWLLLTRRWRIAAGAAAAVMVVTVAALPWTGAAVDLTYIRYLADVGAAHAAGGGAAGATTWEGGVPTMVGLIGLAATLFGQSNAVAVDVLTGVLSALVVVLVAIAMRGRWASPQLPAATIAGVSAAGLLLDPHLYWQDVVLLLVPVALVLPRLDTVKALSVLLAATLVLDLAGVDAFTGNPPEGHLVTLVLIATAVVAALRRTRLATMRVVGSGT